MSLYSSFYERISELPRYYINGKFAILHVSLGMNLKARVLYNLVKEALNSQFGK